MANDSLLNDPMVRKSRPLTSEYDPYQDQANYLEETGWDKLVSALGFRSPYQSKLEDLHLQSNLRSDQILSTSEETEYNNEINKASRMRDAGLNPDLTGLDSSSDASEFAEPENNVSGSPEGLTPEKMISTFNGAITMFTGLVQNVQNIKGLVNKNEQGEMTLLQLMSDEADDFLRDSLNQGVIYTRTGDIGEWTPNIVPEGSTLQAEYERLITGAYKDRPNDIKLEPSYDWSSLTPMFKSKRLEGAFMNLVMRKHRSLNAETNRHQAFADYLSSRSNRYISEGKFGGTDDAIASVLGEYGKALFEVQRLTTELNNLSLKGDISYQSTANDLGLGEGQAFVEGDEQAYLRQSKEYQQKIESAWNNSAKAIQDMDCKPWIKTLGLVVLNILRAQFPMPQIKFGSYQSRSNANIQTVNQNTNVNENYDM